MWTYIIDALLVIALILVVLYPRWNLRRSAKVIDNPEFARLIPTSQLIDIREANQFRIKHILGARNVAATQIEQSLNAISKHKPVLLYENGKPTASAKVARQLKKSGVPEIYVLKGGLSKWDGKVKEG
ncbi:rhodanese-like domain-containing protein [Lactococcus nasutitermitis]|uniref:Rhodanese-like domain-containing protein n=1 Tax=Lactococcus nasutitermitis TaxID=1652957 RepID=A0ABV9JCL7_9LACT|nr:rhodanese-like domain-containing protein [Lactococcus nasutitermitis]